MWRFVLVVILFSSISQFSLGQTPVKPRPSPLAIAQMKFKDTYLKVTYSQPHKRGREIFGALVPYGEVWRTGANEATELTINKPILIGQDTLSAGTYSLFTIPEKENWTVIINEEVGQWGSYNYLPESDILRIKVPVEEIKDVVWEPFTISFETERDYAYLVMRWDQTAIRVPIRFP